MASSNDSAWTIAGGVFLALVIFSGLERCQNAVAQRQAMEYFKKATSDTDPLGWQRADAERKRRNRETKRRADAANALRPDERCINGQRFREVENGFLQIQQPC